MIIGEHDHPVADLHLALALATLHAEAFAGTGRAWSGPEILSLLNEAAVGMRLAHRAHAPDGTLAPAGFALYRCAADEAEILTIAVALADRRAGLGAGLLSACEAGARQAGAARMFLEVAEDNTAARALYARAGYRECGRRHGYYRHLGGEPVDALVLEKRL
ncbi:MAG TPA: GNAT family N-acetyltransferase [Thermohalobaculum sp.]|nr:GNAT family N-acetyltransferase [Thermohalobaculum sp.]